MSALMTTDMLRGSTSGECSVLIIIIVIIIIIYLFIYLLQLGCHPVAVVILHVNKT